VSYLMKLFGLTLQKIKHDLDQWRELELDGQQEWVGRSKGYWIITWNFKRKKRSLI